jgi:hypothetical protein
LEQSTVSLTHVSIDTMWPGETKTGVSELEDGTSAAPKYGDIVLDGGQDADRPVESPSGEQDGAGKRPIHDPRVRSCDLRVSCSVRGECLQSGAGEDLSDELEKT